MRDRETLVFLQVDFDGLTESWCEICTVFLSCLMVRVKTVRWEVGVKKGSFSFDAFAGSRALFWLSCSFLVSHSYLIPPPHFLWLHLLWPFSCIINMPSQATKCQPGVHDPFYFFYLCTNLKIWISSMGSQFLHLNWMFEFVANLNGSFSFHLRLVFLRGVKLSKKLLHFCHLKNTNRFFSISFESLISMENYHLYFIFGYCFQEGQNWLKK